jgi:hypothetical protein
MGSVVVILRQLAKPIATLKQCAKYMAPLTLPEIKDFNALERVAFN